MPTISRAVPAGRPTAFMLRPLGLGAMTLGLLTGYLLSMAPLNAQPPPRARAAAEAPAGKSRPVAPVPRGFGPLEVVPWFSLEPQDSGLIRNSGGAKGIDMSSRNEDDSNITVYGRKKTVDLRTDREHDYSAPGWSDITMPRDIPIGPPSSCSSGAYRTIGGQPANGADLMGGLGGGRC